MASDDDHHTTTVYVDEDIDEEEDDDEESDDEQQQQQDHHNQNLDDEEEDVDLIDEDEEEDDEEIEEDDSTSSAAGEVTIAVAGVPNATAPITVTPTTTATTVTDSVNRSDAIVEVKKPLDDSRRLFQRLWTDEDEIELLQGFLEYTTQRGTNNSSHHHDTTAFYDQIKGKLQLDFNKNQLVEKLRRLKKKYRNVLAKTSSGKEYVFKSPHDQATFDLSCKIWNEHVASNVSAPIVADGGGMDDDDPQNPNINPNFGLNLNEHNGNGIGDPSSSEKKTPRSRKRSRSTATVKIEENYGQQQQYGQAMGAGAGVANPNLNPVSMNMVEETVKSCLLPLFKELVNNSPNGAGGSLRGSGLGLGLGGVNVNSFGGSLNLPVGDMSDEKWRKQHMLELEVYSKRLELMQDEIKSRLEELRSMGDS